MTKKAFCVGINDYPYDDSDLNGCVNDANDWAALLVEHYDFAVNDVKVITDAEATKAAIMAGIKGLLTEAAAGDVLVFTNSSHGTYVADTSGDEQRYDQALCPYDCADDLIVDDELRVLFTDLPDDVHLTAIFDSCFSGSGTRVAVGAGPGRTPPDVRRRRFLNPALRGEPILENIFKARPKRTDKFPEAQMKDVLLSGCADNEYSYDALIDGAFHGAMTYFAIQAIRALNYDITYQQLYDQLSYTIDEAHYPQHPQLEGKNVNKKRRVFT